MNDKNIEALTELALEPDRAGSMAAAKQLAELFAAKPTLKLGEQIRELIVPFPEGGPGGWISMKDMELHKIADEVTKLEEKLAKHEQD